MANQKRVLQVGDMTITPEPRNRYVTLEIGGKKTRVHYKELWSAVFVLGDKGYKDQMIPVKKEERMVFSRKHEVRANRDIKEGEKVVFWCEVDVAETVVKAIAEQNGAKVIGEAPALSTAEDMPPPSEPVQ